MTNLKDLSQFMRPWLQKLVWPIFSCKVGQIDPIVMKLKLEISCFQLDVLKLRLKLRSQSISSESYDILPYLIQQPCSRQWNIRFSKHNTCFSDYNSIPVYQVIIYISKGYPWWSKSIQQFQRYAFRKVWTQFVANLTSSWPMGKPIWGKWANDHNSAQLQA